ncbi:acyltransferase, partial [Salmonella enterica subsp. enterica serovar Oslo]|nr:acyltransferase [Salmonella enterica]EDF9969808.1 acyltransferase [Salmonella enterica subsp. enterica serovar Oslo]EDR8899041.1 acyltransferase [Salmonella enterica]
MFLYFFSPSCVIGRSLTFQMLNFLHSKLTIFSNVHRHKMSNKRLNGIQFLRGFAVLAVVLGHNRGTMYDNIVAG